MTKKLLMSLALCLTTIFAAKAAEKQVYTEFKDGVLTYYYDDLIASRDGITEVYNPMSNTVRFKEYDSKVTKAVIDESMKDAHLTSTYKMFYGGYDQKSYKLSNMTEIVGMENLVTDEVWSMSCMFQFCTKLTTIDLSHLNTANVTDMWGMFYLCYGLTSLDLSLFQTANVRDMGYMFSNCDALTSLDLTSFNISEVTSMESMFAYNSALTTITCNNDWSKSTTLTNSANMFNGCTSLKGGKGTTCDGETHIDVSYARPDGANGMPGYFTAKEGQGDDPGDCTSEGVELYTEFDATTGTLTFYYDDQRCSREGLTEIYEQGAQHYESYHNQVLKAVIDPSMQNAHLTSTAYMFFGGWGETNLTLSAMTEIEGIENLVTDNVTDMHGMFDYCSALLSLDLRSFNTAKVTDMSFMFSGCSALRSLDISTFNTARVTNMSGMFESCSALASLDLSSFNTSNVTNMSSMFSQSGLTMLDLSSFNTAKVTSMSGMFYACDELVSLNVSSFNTAKVKSMRQMFLQCRFTSIDLSSFNTAAVTDMKGMFSQCLYLRSLDLNNFNTANVTNMNCMFEHCYYLTLLDIRSFDIGKVTDMSGMFDDDKRLTTIWCAGDWSNSTALTNSSNMFRGCIALEGDQGTKCDGVNYIDKTYARPDEVDIAGYFTAERLSGDPEVYTEFKDGVLTYYYDNRRSKRTGITEPYNPDDDVAAIRFREYREQITKAVIHESMKDAHLTSTYRMFFGGLEEYYGEQRSYPLSALTQIEGMENLVTDEVRSMEWMFNGCSALTSLDVTHLNTARVTSFGRMFNGCSALTELDINSFNIDNASYLYSMFEGCSALRTIYCNHNWSISTASSVTMFKGCTSLVGGDGTACDGVNAIDKTYARPDYGETYPGYFTGRYPAEVYTSFDEARTTLTYYYDAQRFFREGINELYDPINAPGALRFKGYHEQVKKVKIDATMKNAGLTSMRSMFYGGHDAANSDDLCLYASAIEGMENLITDNVTDMSDVFHGCFRLTSLDLSHFKTDKVTNMSSMFYNSRLSSLDVSHFSTANVTNMNSMFFDCVSLTSLDLSSFTTSKVTDMRNMFGECSSLTLLNLNSFNVSNVTDMRTMFSGCTALKTIICSYFWNNIAGITGPLSSSDMFKNCTSLVGGKGTQCDGTNNIDVAYAHPDGGYNNPGYFSVPATEVYSSYDSETQTLTYYYDDQRFLRAGINELYSPENAPDARRFKEYHNLVKKAVIDASMKKARLTSTFEMFYGGDERIGGVTTHYALQNMTEIEGLENLSIDDAKTMKEMFRKCASLTSIDLSHFKTSYVTDMEQMFEDCRSLTSLDLSSFNTAKLQTTRWMFHGCTELKRIWCSNDWSQSSVLTLSVDMFKNCTSLVGSMGTQCDGVNNIEKDYARPDKGSNNPGYFSEQKTEVYTSFNETTGVLTYYYDDQRFFREGINELYDPVNNPGALRFKGYNEQVTKAVIDASMQNAGLTSMRGMFYGGKEEIEEETKFYSLHAMTEIEGMENLVTNEVTSMNNMFYKCNALTSINFNSFNTANVRDMSHMFVECEKLTSLDLSNFNTDMVTTMYAMFANCMRLTSLDISSFNTANVTNMGSMFHYCTSLRSLDVSKFNTAKVTDLGGMFGLCTSLTSLDLSSFNTENVTSMSTMFWMCKSLTSLDLTSFSIEHLTDTKWILKGCTNLKTILCNEDWSKSKLLTSSDGMFDGCTSLVGGKGTTYDANHADKEYAHPDGGSSKPGYFTAKPEVYASCNNTTDILTYYYDDKRYEREVAGEATKRYDPENNDYYSSDIYVYAITKAVIDASMQNAGLTSTKEMFCEFSQMTEIEGMQNLVTDNVTDMTEMFRGCSKLTSIDLSHLKTDKVKNMSRMFYDCQALTSLDLFSFNTGEVTDMFGMFKNCISLTSLDLNSFNIDKVTDMSQMFDGCRALTTIWCNEYWSKSKVIGDWAEMFGRCYSLVGGQGTTYDSDGAIDYAHPDGGESDPGYFTVAPTEVYTAFNETTGVLTYYYDDQRAAHRAAGEITEVYDPVNNPDALDYHWWEYNLQITKIKVDVSMKDAHLTSTAYMFCQGFNMTEIEGIENLVTDEVKDMKCMFMDCTALTSLNLSSFNTANVTDMFGMFAQCYALTSLDLSNFNTEKVTDMTGMFNACKSLTSLDLSMFNTDNVTGMREMFRTCSALKTILCNDDWSKSEVLTNSNNMFRDCNSLVGGNGTKYDANHTDVTYAHPDGENGLPGYFTEKKKEVYTEFDATSGTLTYYYDDQRDSRKGITVLYEPEKNPNAVRFKDYHDQVYKVKIDASMKNAHLTSMSTMFSSGDDIYRLWSLSEISGMENLVTDEVTDMSWMFYGCSRLTSLDVSRFNTANVTNMKGMFYRCEALKSLDLSHFKTDKVTNMSSMFYNSRLSSLDVSHFNTCNVTNMSNMFASCSQLTSIDLSSFNTENVTDMSSMFSYCSRLSSLDVSHFNTANVTNMLGMFYRCASLTSLDLSKFDTKNVTDMGYMFEGCTSLTSLDISKYNTAKVTDMRAMFKNCTKITSLNLSTFNTKNVQYMQEMFMDCSLLASIDFGSFNTTNVSYMTDMFSGCKSLVTLDLTSFNAVKKANRSSMFKNCSSLTTILCNEDFSQHNYSSYGMFSGCTSLVGGKGTKCDGVNNIDEEYARPDEGSSKPGYFTGDIKQSSLQSIPTNGPSTFDFSLFDPAGSELLGITLGSWDWYNWGEGRMEISTTNTEEEIDEKLNAAFAGAASLKSLLPGTITFKLEAGQGEIEIDCKTVPGYVLKVRIAEYGTASISSTIEQAIRGKATVTYKVSQKTYVVIYLEGASSGSKVPARIATEDDTEGEEIGAYIYSITIKPIKGTPTELENTISDSIGAQKLIYKGNLYILRDGKRYNAQGARME